MSAIIEYMWCKFFTDSDGSTKFIPQFLQDGTQQFWTDSQNIHPTKLVLTPIAPELAATLQARSIPAVSVPLPTYTFQLLPDDDIIAYWDNEISISSHYECDACGAAWLHDASKSRWAQCPRCGQKDTWSCLRCGRQEIDNNLVVKTARGETNCPYCDIPYGLNRARHLQCVSDIIENTDYVIKVEGRYKITIHANDVLVESVL